MLTTMIRARRAAAADWNAKAAEAQPGEVWTSSYHTRRAVQGGRFASYTAGPVRIIGDECPVKEFRGQKRLGESGLDTPMGSRLLALIHPTTNYRLDRGDVAPILDPLRCWLPEERAAFFSGGRDGVMVTVEHRYDHPVCAGLRSVEIGCAGDIEDFNDGAGLGRYVGDTWVRLADVTGVQW